MYWGILSNFVILVHFVFIVFVLMGGLLTLRWRWIPWLHLPAAIWAIALEFGGWMCPLTYLENWIRELRAESGYPGGFIEYYLIPLIYPTGLTASLQILLGVSVLILNIVIYSWVSWRIQWREE